MSYFNQDAPKQRLDSSGDLNQARDPRDPYAGHPARRAFDTHLDMCQQCAHHPFDLCKVGEPLFFAAGAEAEAYLKMRGITPPGGWGKMAPK